MSILILIADDHGVMRAGLRSMLEDEPELQVVGEAANGEQALQLAGKTLPDIALLDIGMPGMDGIELLTQLRRESNVYVILLTARTEEVDKIVGLSVGADDYVTKPFSPRELIARIKASLRRLQSGPGSLEGGVLAFRRVRIDAASRQAWVDERPVELTAIEFDLLYTLAEHRGRVLSREQLLEKVWGYDYYGEMRVVDVHIGHLRDKLGDDSLIATVRGVGYRFDDEVG